MSMEAILLEAGIDTDPFKNEAYKFADSTSYPEEVLKLLLSLRNESS